MYGLKQAAALAYNQLSTHYQTASYQQVPESIGMWTHISNKLSFCLCVDDFGLKYFKQHDAQEFLSHFETAYKYTEDWSGGGIVD